MNYHFLFFQVIIENLVTDVFASVATMEDALESLCAFYNYSRRENLKIIFDRKTTQVDILTGDGQNNTNT